MTRRLLALLGAILLVVTAVTPGIARQATSAPAAAPERVASALNPAADPAPGRVSSAPTSAVDETKVPHYFGPYPNWSNSQFTLPDVAVTIDAAAPPVAPITVGNPLISRQYASDNTVGGAGSGTPGQGTVLVILQGALPAGTLQSFQTYTQVSDAAGFTSVGNSFNAYVLRPTLNPNEYSVVYDSGTLTVPAEADGIHTWAVAGSPAVELGDVVAFYGQGIPLDLTGTDVVAYPAPAPPPATGTFVVDAPDFPQIAPRMYSFAATVAPPSGPASGTGATAVATVGANGAVTGITITNPGHDYANATVKITGAGTGATADAVVQTSGAVTAVTVGAGGGGYTAPVVTISGGGATTDATATAFGGVDAIVLSDPGSGYTMPNVSIDFPDGPDGTQASAHVVCDDGAGGTVACPQDGSPITLKAVVVDNPGSGYSTAPGIVILDGTLNDPIIGATPAVAAATLTVQSVTVDTFGAGYTSAPTVAIADSNGGTGDGATATATTDYGAVTAITNLVGGSGYITPGIKKFEDALPGLCTPPACPDYQTAPDAKYIPLAVPEAKTYNGIAADEYVIGLVQYRTSFSSSLDRLQTTGPKGTLVRGYIQLETPANVGVSQHYPVTNELLDGTKVPVLKSDGTPWLAVTPPQWLGPTIGATKDKPVRIVFHNLLPKDAGGDLFLPTDTSLMGSGLGPDGMGDPIDEGVVTDAVRNPPCSEPWIDKPTGGVCFSENRATLHLHGGITPWISDGTPHQWITPAGETTKYPQGVSVGNVPDMDVCTATDDGCQTFYYTNQQSARLMFYHDHAWGITRLNVYAGEAAGYLISDDTEKKLISSGTIPADQLPLVVQDRTFVPDAVQLAQQDPTWNTARWGGMGNFWYHHVYMPAQNPGDPSGMSAYGRWMYGPWFWPPATPPHGPIANPYYNMDPKADPPFSKPLAVPCNLDDPATWQYDTDPFCEPKEIPGTPNISVGMEQFNDTPIVNGVAYPTVTLEPKAYRLRILNAANDRFFNFQWYVGEDATASTGLNKAGQPIGPTEVALNPTEVAAAQTDPVVFPTPAAGGTGPDWVVIGSEGGFLPAPVVRDGQQPTTWITDPTRFDVGNVDKFSLLLAPAERADAIVDFSQFAGKTLILYNDAPAAFPARVPSYDYYTGAPDQFPNAAPGILPGYGPNTRTVMQVKIADLPKAPAFDVTKLRNAFSHKADGSGVFESGQHPIIVGQSDYNSAYGTSFAASSDCNRPDSTLQRCDGLVRINDGTQPGSTWGFNTLKAPNAKMSMKFEPKAIHDEMNSTAFDEFGRMTANLGIEAQPPTPGLQNVTLYPYINPSTELIDATNLPKNDVVYDANGLPLSDVKITPISSASDGSQIWRVTHNGVDTHPIHFHLYDVQVLNRVAWDNIITKTDPTELGWKDTVRISPLQDTIVALRPIIPDLPWELPNAIRLLNPMMMPGFTNPDPAFPNIPFNNISPQGIPTAPIVNQLVNFGWEYVFHCHILSHEEMDMMRPVSVAMPPVKADGLVRTTAGGRNVITFNDNSISETAYVLQKSSNGIVWTDVATSFSPLDVPNTKGTSRSLTDGTSNTTVALLYRIAARNTVGYGAEFPSMTVESLSPMVGVNTPTSAPAAPTNLTLTLQAGPQVRLQWRDNATNEAGFVIERATAEAGPFDRIGVAPARNNTGNTTFTDTTIAAGTQYWYRVAAVNLFDFATTGTYSLSAYSNTATTGASAAVPAAPSNLVAVNGADQGNKRSVALTWTDNSANETGFTLQRATNATFTSGLNTSTVAANATTVTQTGLSKATTYYFRIRSDNGTTSSSAWVNATPFPIVTNP